MRNKKNIVLKVMNKNVASGLFRSCPYMEVSKKGKVSETQNPNRKVLVGRMENAKRN